MTQETPKTLRERVVGKLGYGCGGPRCPHETAEDHWILEMPDINDIISLVREETLNEVEKAVSAAISRNLMIETDGLAALNAIRSLRTKKNV